MSFPVILNSPRTLTLLATTISGLGIYFPFLWFLVPIGLGLFVYVLWFLTHTLKQAVFLGLLFGTGTGAVSIGWFWSALPLAWLAGNNEISQILAVGIAWLVVSAAFGIGTAVVSPLIWYTRRNIFAPLLVPGMWTITELARMWAFSLINYAPQSLVGAHFSGAAFGYALTESHLLLQFAQFGGIHALNFLVGVFAVCFVILIRISTRRATQAEQYLGVLLCLCIIVPLMFFQTKRRDTGRPVPVQLISTYVPIETHDEETLKQLPSLLRSTASTSTTQTIIVLPESERLVALFPAEKDIHKELKKFFPNNDTLIVTAGHVPTATGSSVTELSYTSNIGGTLGTYNKMFLMPLGEYIPVLSIAEFSLLSNQRLQAYITTPQMGLLRGLDVTSVQWNGLTIGALVCSDNQSPILYRTIEKRSHASVLINVSNTSWFHDSHFLFSKNIQIAKVHAVQNNAYYLSADNMAPAFVIDPGGVVVAQSTWYEPSILNAYIYPE